MNRMSRVRAPPGAKKKERFCPSSSSLLSSWKKAGVTTKGKKYAGRGSNPRRSACKADIITTRSPTQLQNGLTPPPYVGAPVLLREKRTKNHAPTRIRTWVSGFKVRSDNHYTMGARCTSHTLSTSFFSLFCIPKTEQKNS